MDDEESHGHASPRRRRPRLSSTSAAAPLLSVNGRGSTHHQRPRLSLSFLLFCCQLQPMLTHSSSFVSLQLIGVIEAAANVRPIALRMRPPLCMASADGPILGIALLGIGSICVELAAMPIICVNGIGDLCLASTTAPLLGIGGLCMASVATSIRGVGGIGVLCLTLTATSLLGIDSLCMASVAAPILGVDGIGGIYLASMATPLFGISGLYVASETALILGDDDIGSLAFAAYVAALARRMARGGEEEEEGV